MIKSCFAIDFNLKIKVDQRPPIAAYLEFCTRLFLFTNVNACVSLQRPHTFEETKYLAIISPLLVQCLPTTSLFSLETIVVQR